jgi:hypothetical protein
VQHSLEVVVVLASAEEAKRRREVGVVDVRVPGGGKLDRVHKPACIAPVWGAGRG